MRGTGKLSSFLYGRINYETSQDPLEAEIICLKETSVPSYNIELC